MSEEKGLAKGRWDKLDSKRNIVLERQRKCAAISIPALLPPKDYREDEQLPTPYQGLGARAVNSLSAKLLLTILPPNTPFFRLSVDPLMESVIKEQMGDKEYTKVEEQLAKIEKKAVKVQERDALRVHLFRALKYLIALGNTLLEIPEEGRIKAHRPDKYVVRRSPSGRPLEIILREVISPEEIPQGIEVQGHVDENKDEEEIELFSYCRWKTNRWSVFQECLNQEIPETAGSFQADNFPFMALTWSLQDGENYGRGHVEEYLGDFLSLDGLSMSLLEGAAAMAKLIFLKDPNGVTNLKDIQEAPNGGFVSGKKDDIGVLQAEKYADFKIAHDESIRIEQRLAAAFLLTDSIQRNAERVTATEIRLLAQDLEDSLGGIYSVLSQDLQMPLAIRILKRLASDDKLFKLPEGVEPTITTGFEALGRGHDLQKLEALLVHLEPLGPENVITWLQIDEYIARTCIALGIDKAGLITPRKVVDKMMQDQKMEAMMMQMAPKFMEMMKGMGGIPNVQEG
jgi:hypothetical protein